MADHPPEGEPQIQADLAHKNPEFTALWIYSIFCVPIIVIVAFALNGYFTITQSK